MPDLLQYQVQGANDLLVHVGRHDRYASVQYVIRRSIHWYYRGKVFMLSHIVIERWHAVVKRAMSFAPV